MTDDDTLKLIQLWKAKSYELLAEAEDIFDLKFYNTCINRLYFSSFFMVNALLLKNGFKPKTHSGVRNLLNKHFFLTGKLDNTLMKYFFDISKMRADADYEATIEYDDGTAVEYIEKTKIFISKIKKLIEE